MTRLEWPDGFYVDYAHDVTGAITTITEKPVPPAAGVVLASYGYDNLGLVTAVARNGGAGAATSYGYDAFARLTSLAHDASGSGSDLTLGFSYNPAGQITCHGYIGTNRGLHGVVSSNRPSAGIRRRVHS